MTDTITLTGLVATMPRHIATAEGLNITSFRLASTQRRFDRSQERWIDGETNWYTITTFRQLALNAASSIEKGQRVVVTGRLRIREWANGDKTGTTIDIEADALGHDQSWGTSSFARTISSSASLPDAPADAPATVTPAADTPVADAGPVDVDVESERPAALDEWATPLADNEQQLAAATPF
ncbi:MAG: single-stranded DNA-binding protein [Microbacteriaceae bacterium]